LIGARNVRREEGKHDLRDGGFQDRRWVR
jgi:hypothetical protein